MLRGKICQTTLGQCQVNSLEMKNHVLGSPPVQKNELSDSTVKVAIIGRIPPPYGGVGVHLLRFLSEMRRAKLPFTFLDLDGNKDASNSIEALPMNWLFISRLLRLPYEVLHFHTSRVPQLLVLLLVLRFRPHIRVIITLHNQTPMLFYTKTSTLFKRVFNWFFKRADHIIATNKCIGEWATNKLGLNSRQVDVIPAYLPPSNEELQYNGFPQVIQSFFESHHPVIGSQGYYGNFMDGEHVYRFEELANLLSKLKKHYPNIGCYTAISGCYSENHRAKIRALRDELDLGQHWMLQEEPFPAVPLYTRCDLFLRPTVTDGDSVSIRECLSIGTPVLASDAVSRPPGATTYPQHDADKLYQLSRNLLDVTTNDFPSATTSGQTNNDKLSDSAAKIVNIYRAACS